MKSGVLRNAAAGIYIIILMLLSTSCEKNVPYLQELNPGKDPGSLTNPAIPQYNLDVALRSETVKDSKEDISFGFIKFRQNPDTARIIDLDTWVFHLEPDRAYQLQRAVNPITDNSCSSIAWLTLGSGLVPLSLHTDLHGDGHADLFRNVTSVAREAAFRIHFQVIDSITKITVLTSDCYAYKVR